MRFLGVLLLAASVFCGSASAEAFSLGRPEHLILERDKAGSVGIGDADGDGRMDLVVSEDLTWSTHRLSLFVQQADGSLSTGSTLLLPDDFDFGFGLPVRLVDLDQDGADEIVVGGGGLAVVRLVDGEMTIHAIHPSMHGCAHLAVARIDADDFADIVCHSGLGTPTSASVFYGDGALGFHATSHKLTKVGSFGQQQDFMGMRVADVTGDGRPDLVVTASRVGSFFVHPNEDGVFSDTPTEYPHPQPSTTPYINPGDGSTSGVWPGAIEALDVDGDGVNEVVTASRDAASPIILNLYRQTGGGQLVLSERIPFLGRTTALLARDFDGDGDEELLAGHFGLNAVTVSGMGGSTLDGYTRFDMPGFGRQFERDRMIGQSKALAIGDLDSDGCDDVVGATYSGIVLLYGCREFRNRVPVSDFDGDGVSDVLWLYRGVDAGTNYLYLWQWADVEAWRNCYQPCPESKDQPWIPRATGDFDGDGNSDTFWRNEVTGENAYLAAAHHDRQLATVANLDWKVVAAGDFDGDDRSDLFWRHATTGANVVWRGGDSRSPLATWGVTDVDWKVAGVGDFNGDGRSDVFWRHALSGRNAIWLSGRYQTQQVVSAVTNVHWGVRGVGDFNGDGKDDIAWRNASTGANAIWLSGRSNTQQKITNVTNVNWDIVGVGDYNGDGNSDLLWRNLRTGTNVIWRSGRYQFPQRMDATSPLYQAVR